MDQEKMQNIALMRYSAIAPLITGLQGNYDSLEAFFRAASVKGVTQTLESQDVCYEIRCREVRTPSDVQL